MPHVINFSYGYELPFGAGKRCMNHKGPADWVLGGWQFNGIVTHRSGFLTDIRSSRVAAANQMYATINVPDRVQGVSMYLPNPGWTAGSIRPRSRTRSRCGTPRAIRLRCSATPRGAWAVDPASTNMDFSLFKNFRIRERVNVQFRAEAFNLTNTPTFFLPSASNAALTIGNPAFGKLSSSSATGRQLQFGLKLSF